MLGRAARPRHHRGRGRPAAPVAPIGDIIHNPQVVARLRDRGVIGAESVDAAAREGFKRVAITAHGMGPHLAQQASEAHLELIDTTCPLVTKVQRLAQKLVRQGYFLVVYGDSYHPEVKSVLGWAATSKSVAAKQHRGSSLERRRGEEGEGKIVRPRKVALVSQTTKNVDELMKFAMELQAMVVPEGGEFRLCNTICEPTSERQNALKRLIERDHCDIVFAIGGRKSSNTARLAEVASQMGVESHHIERPEDIQPEWLDGKTDRRRHRRSLHPGQVIQEVVDTIVGYGYARPPAASARSTRTTSQRTSPGPGKILKNAEFCFRRSFH